LPEDPRAVSPFSPGDHALSRFDGDVTPLVESLLTYRFPVFGGVPLTEVLSFRSLWKQAAIDAVNLADEHRRLESGNPRGLIAAAALRFADDPEDYERSKAGPRTVAEVLAVQTAGPRFRGGGRPGPNLDEVDRAAALAQYRRLAEAG
jgi:hypothetical protein